MKRFFTSESVTEGHPDKLCDYISDSILDSYLEKDPLARVACETVASKGEIYITGEISSCASIDIEKVVRKTIAEIGYDRADLDMDYRTCNIRVNLSKQSPDIALGVDQSLEEKQGENIVSEGAGDQGMMFGFACKETKEYMPMPIALAHQLAEKLTKVRKEKIVDYLRPDGKVQITVEYQEEKPVRVDTIVHMKKYVIEPVIPEKLLDEKTKYYINPTGRFVIGGPLGDSGLTGRKIIVDTYGGYARHGGGAFSGKDASKVDRTAAYMARFLAKNVVANNLAEKCEIQLSYAIGVAKPVSIYVETFGTAKIPEEEIGKKIEENFDLTPRGMITFLNLRTPIYRKTTNYGHFGKKELPWEKVIPMV